MYLLVFTLGLGVTIFNTSPVKLKWFKTLLYISAASSGLSYLPKYKFLLSILIWASNLPPFNVDEPVKPFA